MFDLAAATREDDMTAYVELQEREFALEAVRVHRDKHQREVGTGYFDRRPGGVAG